MSYAGASSRFSQFFWICLFKTGMYWNVMLLTCLQLFHYEGFWYLVYWGPHCLWKPFGDITWRLKAIFNRYRSIIVAEFRIGDSQWKQQYTKWSWFSFMFVKSFRGLRERCFLFRKADENVDAGNTHRAYVHDCYKCHHNHIEYL